jgi:hypothetical protein
MGKHAVFLYGFNSVGEDGFDDHFDLCGIAPDFTNGGIES